MRSSREPAGGVAGLGPSAGVRVARLEQPVDVMALALVGDHVVCDTCVVADTFATRLRGLLGRRSLPSGEGLLIRRESSVHTCFMRFAIDVVFLDADLRVLRVDSNVGPWRLKACRGAQAVLELRADRRRSAGSRRRSARASR